MSENPFSQIESQKSIETLKNESQERLHDILHTQLTVENIETFASDAFDQTLELINDLLKEYRNNPNLEGDLTLNNQEQEDDVCQKLELPNIQEILGRILEVEQKIDALKTYLKNPKEQSKEVITPPDHTEEINILNAGAGTFEKKKLIPRLLTLMYLLESDFDIDVQDKERVRIIEGEVADTIMRKTPYTRVVVHELDRVVYVCDEVENVSYVFDTKKLHELGITLDDLDIDGKQDKNSLVDRRSGVGARIAQTPNWRFKLSSYLREDIPNHVNEDLLSKKQSYGTEESPRVSSGEFDPWKGFYVDPISGKHFSTIQRICDTLNERGIDVSATVIFGQDRENLESKNIVALDGRIRSMYAYEDIVTHELMEKLNQPRVENKGEWSSFWQDPESGYHYATVSQLSKRLLISEQVLKNYILELESAGGIQKRIVRSSKFDLTAYPYEVLVNNPDIVKLSNRFSTESVGEWKNFYIDSEGKHWGTIGAIHNKTSIHSKTLRAIVMEGNLDSKLTDQGESFCLETILASSFLKERLEAKVTLDEGEWKNFYIDEKSEQHIGTLKAIRRKSGRTYEAIKKISELHNMKPVKILVKHQICDGYCYEDIIKEYNPDRDASV